MSVNGKHAYISFLYQPMMYNSTKVIQIKIKIQVKY
jgi:hypothetical protein